MEIGVLERYGKILMKLIKLGVISVIALFIVVTLIGLLFPSKVVVSRAIDIEAPADSIYAVTKDLFGWKKWVQGLESKEINSGSQTKIGNSTIFITAVSKEKISGKWVEKNGDQQTTDLYIIATPQNKTIVNWQFEQQIKWYPWTRLSSMLNEKVIGQMMEMNLANMKKIIENK